MRHCIEDPEIFAYICSDLVISEKILFRKRVIFIKVVSFYIFSYIPLYLLYICLHLLICARSLSFQKRGILIKSIYLYIFLYTCNIFAYICLYLHRLGHFGKSYFQKKGTFYQRCKFLYICLYSSILAIYLPTFAYICLDLVISQEILGKKREFFIKDVNFYIISFIS